MSTTYYGEESLVRHKGSIAIVTCRGNDGGYRQDVVSGERRARQIGRRHWVRKESSGHSSGGGYWDDVTIKPPCKEEHHLRKPISG